MHSQGIFGRSGDGDGSGKLIQLGGQAFEIQSDRDVFLGGDLYRVRIEDANVEPWNPAVLEQRIAQAYRMGQKQPVHVYKFVTTHAACPTIEEGLLTTLAAKQDLADASINIDSNVDEVAMQSGMEDLKRRLEVILPPKLAAPMDESQQRRVEAEVQALAGEKRREQVATAGGQLLSAALSLAGGLAGDPNTAPDPAKADALTSKLGEAIERDEQGRPQLKISLASDEALRDLATTLARLLG